MAAPPRISEGASKEMTFELSSDAAQGLSYFNIDVSTEGTVLLDVGGDGLMTFACAALTIEEVAS